MGGASFCTRKWLEDQDKFDKDKLIGYGNYEFVIDDDIVKKETGSTEEFYRNFILRIQNNSFDNIQVLGYLQSDNLYLQFSPDTIINDCNAITVSEYSWIIKGKGATVLINLEPTDYRITDYNTVNCMFKNGDVFAYNNFPVTLNVVLNDTIQDTIVYLEISKY